MHPSASINASSPCDNMMEDRRAVTHEMLVERMARRLALPISLASRRAALDQRQVAEIVAVVL